MREGKEGAPELTRSMASPAHCMSECRVGASGSSAPL